MWYAVNLLFKSDGCEPESELFWEERMVIFRVESEVEGLRPPFPD